VIVLKPPLQATIGHLLNQRRLLALLFVTSCVDPPSTVACALVLASRLSLDGLVSTVAAFASCDAPANFGGLVCTFYLVFKEPRRCALRRVPSLRHRNPL
jgi:hypothetical protein